MRGSVLAASALLAALPLTAAENKRYRAVNGRVNAPSSSEPSRPAAAAAPEVPAASASSRALVPRSSSLATPIGAGSFQTSGLRGYRVGGGGGKRSRTRTTPAPAAPAAPAEAPKPAAAEVAKSSAAAKAAKPASEPPPDVTKNTSTYDSP